MRPLPPQADDLKPDVMLTQRVTYPQFVEVLGAMLAIKASSQTPTGSVMASVLLAPSLTDMLQHLPQVRAHPRDNMHA